MSVVSLKSATVVSHLKTKPKVGGLVPFTATDYPGKIAAVIFIQGCPWRCGYCHNPHLQPRTEHSPVDWTDVIDFLRRRQGLIDGVVFSGGEPSMDPALFTAIEQVRALGYSIGLHTGGTHPRRIAEVIDLLDWIGLDIKTNFSDYERVTKIANSGQPAQKTLEIIANSGCDFECRTTIHPSLISSDELLQLAQNLADYGVRNYAVQVFRTQGCIDESLNTVPIHNWPETAVVNQIADLFDSFVLRHD